MRRIILLLIWLCLTSSALATTYYVRTDGSNSNTGTANSAGGAWLTITYAEAHTSPGDTVRVQAGTYNEFVTITPGGSAGNYLTFLGERDSLGTSLVTCYGFQVSASSYVRIIGFEIRHTSTTYSYGIVLSGTSTYVEVLDNYIHNTYKTAIKALSQSATSYVTVRGNYISQVGYISGVADSDAYTAIETNFIKPDTTQGLTADHWLIEYNTSINNIDAIHAYGAYHVMLNNYVPQGRTPSGYHPDIFQSGSDSITAGTAHHLVEATLGGNMTDSQAHFGIWQDQPGGGMYANDTDFVIRGNVAFIFGSSGVLGKQTDHVSTYNNTFYKMAQVSSTGTTLSFFKGSGDTKYPDYPVVANTIIYDYGLATDAIYIQPGTTGAVLTNNLGYLAGSESSYVSTADPQFTNAASYNFLLQSGSPARGLGTALVLITTSSASGTSFDVDKPLLLRDGYGISQGDLVTVGGTTTYITSISGNTVTVADSVTWTTNAPIYWGLSSTVDLGALPYAYATTPTVTNTTATVSPTALTSTSSTPNAVRKVEFLINGLSIGTVNYSAAGTYSYTNTPSGACTLEARAYNLWASSTLTVSSYLLLNQDPSALGATAVSPAQINLAWTDNSAGADSFSVERSANGSTGWAEIGTTAATVVTYQNTGLAASTTYYYRVRAVSGGVYSGYTSNANATTQASASFANGLRNPAALGAGF